MATLVIKNLPDDVHAALKERAIRHRRSVTKEVVMLIESSLASGSRVAPDLPQPLKLKGKPITTREIDAAVAKGRD